MLGALFYPLTFGQAQIAELVLGVIDSYDMVDFADEAGGDVDQALAVPLLPAMDTIVVTEARLVLRASPKDLDIENFHVSDNGDRGFFLSLDEPSRLKKVEIGYSYTPPAGAPPTRVVVRAASGNGALQAGVPLFAQPHFGKPGPMFGDTLGGMTVSDLGGSRYLLTLPAVLGSAWLIQLAAGNDVTELDAIALTPSLNRVVLQALPRNLSVVLAPDGDAVTLWQNPGVLLPESGDQEINFAPLAQKHLSASLAAAGGEATLPVPLRFHSDSGAAVQVVTKSLVAEYRVEPLRGAATTLFLRGDLTPLKINAPAGLKPARSSLRLTAKLLGRELNAASTEPAVNQPSAGLRVGMEHWIAAATAVAPRAGEAAGTVVEIASVRLYLAAAAATEVVLEIRSDIAGAPGAMVTAPLVLKLEPGACGWQEFELPQPLKVVAGNAPIWQALRTNNGEVHWFSGAYAAPAPAARVSRDRGGSWGEANPQLDVPAPLLAQVFHRVDDPLATPAIRLQHAATILQANLFAGATATGPREYQLDAAALPAALLDALAARTGAGRVDTEFLLFSPSAMDLVVDSLTLSYDPFDAGGAA
jgi:hypothetical protein